MRFSEKWRIGGMNLASVLITKRRPGVGLGRGRGSLKPAGQQRKTMKKLISALAGTGLLTLTLGVMGCGDTSSVTDKKEVKAPGGTTTTTTKTEVKETGNNPPPAGTTTPAAPK